MKKSNFSCLENFVKMSKVLAVFVFLISGFTMSAQSPRTSFQVDVTELTEQYGSDFGELNEYRKAIFDEINFLRKDDSLNETQKSVELVFLKATYEYALKAQNVLTGLNQGYLRAKRHGENMVGDVDIDAVFEKYYKRLTI